MIIISYKYPPLKNKGSISKKLFGYKDSTHNGKYIYYRKGLLSNYNYEKLGPGFLKVCEKNKKTILQLLQQNGLIIKEH